MAFMLNSCGEENHPEEVFEPELTVYDDSIQMVQQPAGQFDHLTGKWIRTEVYNLHGFDSHASSFFEYFPDSTFLNEQRCYSDIGSYWISDSILFEVWPGSDTITEKIIYLDSITLVIIDRRSDTLTYRKV